MMRGPSLQNSQTWLLSALETLGSTLDSESQSPAPPQSGITGQKHTNEASIHLLRRIETSVRQRLKRDLIQYQLISEAGGACQRCLNTFHPNIYDFHHIDPSVKLFNLDRSNFNRSYPKLKLEAAKCALLCANCHRETHTYMDKRFLKFDNPKGFLDYSDDK